jgi:F0F1-type ATP synthase assembly protein I
MKLDLKGYGQYIQFGSQMGLSMSLPIIGGFWLDGKLDSSPWFLLLGIFLGLASSVWTIYKLVVDLNIQEEEKKRKRERTN